MFKKFKIIIKVKKVKNSETDLIWFFPFINYLQYF